MGFVEDLFQKIWNSKVKRDKSQLEVIQLSDVRSYVNAIGQYVLGSGELKQIVPSKSYTGFIEDMLYLPERIYWSKNHCNNKNSYLYLTLLACATKKLKIYSKDKTDSLISKRVEFLRRHVDVNLYLDEVFIGFKDFQKGYLESIEKEAPSKGPLDLISVWRIQTLSRSISSDVLIPKMTFKAKDELPNYLQFSTVHNMVDAAVLDADSLEGALITRKKEMTEFRKIQSSPIKKVNLNEKKKEYNPVSHSFEKMETADDYSGGYRLESGDDQLQDHLDALQELDMSNVTSQGEAAQSFYSADMNQIFVSNQNENDIILDSKFLYPEWFSKKQSYKQNYCTLTEQSCVNAHSSVLKDCVSKEFASEIQSYKYELERLVNQPVWFNRQVDGAELDMDECVRFAADRVNGSVHRAPRLFMSKKKTSRDAEVFLLFDQSLSTDSWVENTRIFNVIQDSLVMMGLVFDGLMQTVQIAGTWSATRKNCVFNFVKRKSDSWANFYKNIDIVEPQGYTRLGPSIRHAGSYLKKSDAKKKILILLTDGKPSDLDTYEGVHGIQDIKKACAELETEGIFTIAVLIDKGEKEYFSRMFKRYFVVSSPKKLAPCLFHILRDIIK